MNDKAESAVKTAKRILQKALNAGTDPYVAMLDYRNTHPRNRIKSGTTAMNGKRREWKDHIDGKPAATKLADFFKKISNVTETKILLDDDGISKGMERKMDEMRRKEEKGIDETRRELHSRPSQDVIISYYQISTAEGMEERMILEDEEFEDVHSIVT